MRPREVPVAKPSSAQTYIPQALLRSVSKPRRTQWLPNERKPGTSKHLRERQRQEHGVHSVPVAPAPVELCSDQQVAALLALEGQVERVESDLARFVEEFYVAAAMATAQADGQNRLMARLQAAMEQRPSQDA